MRSIRILVLALASGCGGAWAAAIPGDLVIQASSSFDLDASTDAANGGVQSGSLNRIVGGVAGSMAMAGSWQAGGSFGPGSFLLTQTGDGVGASSTIGGTVSGATAGKLWGDYSFALTNNSATTTYSVLFRATVTSSASASGADAYSYANVSALENFNEFWFHNRQVDTLNASNNTGLTGTALATFVVTLLPGASYSFDVGHTQEGGVFAQGAFAGSLDGFFSIDTVRSSGGPPNPVPLPGALALSLLGLGLLAQRRRG